MAWFNRDRGQRTSGSILEIEKLDVYYGRAHALQEVSLTLDHGVLAVVGRNGMGKTTLCNTVTGLIQGIGTASGSVRLGGEEILGLAPHAITRRGVGYVPQGRRVWPSLSVDEHLRLAAKVNRGAWTVERVYQIFPRLAERKRNGGAELSGGEQQMLAIGRALLFNPRLLVMDEPTEGLAPVIVRQVADMLKRLAADGEISVLLIEQNLGVAVEAADTVDVMMNGRIARSMPAAELAADRDLQQRLLGVRAAGEEENGDPPAPEATAALAERDAGEVRVLTVRRSGDVPGLTPMSAPGEARAVRGFTRWNAGDPQERPRDRLVEARAEPTAAPPSLTEAAAAVADSGRDARVLEFPVGATIARAAYVAGTFDTKGRELFYLRNCLDKLGLRTVTVDLATSGKPSPAMIHPREVARHHPRGERAVFTGDRGTAVTEMAVAFEHFLVRRRDLGGLVSAGGSGGTALATQAMRRLPIGVPKVMVSTVASGDVRPYVGPSDICMMYSVTDVSGINRISERVLANAAHALAGMIAYARGDATQSESKPAIGLTMFGLTTTCVQAVTKQLEERYDCLVFHATGTGGQSMEKLVDSGLLAGVIDVTTTEITDEIVGGVLSAGPARLEAMVRARIPYVGSCGALDMVNFWAMDTVPERFRGRKLHRHNQNVTLMRTTPEEAARIGTFIVERLNRMDGPVRFLIPEGGVSGVDAPDRPFWDPAADTALFDAIAGGFRTGANRRLVRLPHHINDPAFADALVAAFNEIAHVPATVRALRV
jgi:uncharacterized protein (UPF0261 family)/ABC-type branched-subunit amino acid transport system ATPase component